MSVSFEEAIFIGHLATSGQQRTLMLTLHFGNNPPEAC